MKRKVAYDMPRELSRRIMRRGAQGGPVVVIFDKGGKPKKNIFGFDEYQKVKAVAGKGRHRKASTSSGPDPLGAVDARIVGGLGRDDIYE